MGAYEDVVQGYSSYLQRAQGFARAIGKLSQAHRRVNNLEKVQKLRLKWAEETHNAQLAAQAAEISYKDKQLQALQFDLTRAQEAEGRRVEANKLRKQLVTDYVQGYLTPGLEPGKMQESRTRFQEQFANLAGIDEKSAQGFDELVGGLVGSIYAIPQVERQMAKDAASLGNALLERRQKSLALETGRQKHIDETVERSKTRLLKAEGLPTVEEVTDRYKQVSDGIRARLATITPELSLVSNFTQAQRQNLDDSLAAGDMASASSVLRYALSGKGDALVSAKNEGVDLTRFKAIYEKLGQIQLDIEDAESERNLEMSTSAKAASVVEHIVSQNMQAGATADEASTRAQVLFPRVITAAKQATERIQDMPSYQSLLSGSVTGTNLVTGEPEGSRTLSPEERASLQDQLITDAFQGIDQEIQPYVRSIVLQYVMEQGQKRQLAR